MINLLFEELPDAVEVSGSSYKIATDFRSWIAFFDMMENNELSQKQKISFALRWFENEIPHDIVKGYNALADFASYKGIHFESPKKENSESFTKVPSLS